MKRSALIVPISIIIHLSLINGILYLFMPFTYLEGMNALYYNFSWLIITSSLKFYPTERKDTFSTNVLKFLQLLLIFGLAFFALEGFNTTKETYPLNHQILVFIIISIALLAYRILFYIIRANYRIDGGNYRKVVVIGRDRNLKKLRTVFDRQNLGYRYEGYFDNQSSESKTYLGKKCDAFEYILNNEIDYIYCTVSSLTKEELRNLIIFADNNFKKLKMIPDNKDIFSKSMAIELYDSVPVIAIRKSPLESEYSPLIKRTFDIVFSSLVILLVLSWLTPLLFVILRLESKGPLFFKQKRHGVNRKEFWCYKFRSMVCNSDSDDLMASKNDKRITTVGRILRKTSIDELPQFINVLLGSMSVVGPRPHMEFHTKLYETSVDKYLVRHFVKPGITGLAQIKGCRGEIMKQTDIINRVRFDILYLEKWSLILDFNIVYFTIINAIRGEEKAY